MPKNGIGVDPREWRGNRKTYLDSYRKYDFPVTVRKVASGEQREASDQ
ncbi:hypothetical protein ACFTZI_20630 [Streptomyces decoyicus]